MIHPNPPIYGQMKIEKLSWVQYLLLTSQRIWRGELDLPPHFHCLCAWTLIGASFPSLFSSISTVIWTSLNPYPHHRCLKIPTMSWNLTLMNFCAVKDLNVRKPNKFKVSKVSECTVETNFSRIFCSSSSSSRKVFSSCYLKIKTNVPRSGLS